jgi:hypothetical protein
MMDTQEERYERSLHQEFWQDVKETLDQAREDPPPADKVLQTPAEADPSVSSTMPASDVQQICRSYFSLGTGV